MKSHFLALAGVSVLMLGLVSRAEIKTIAERSNNPTAGFKL